MILITGGAGFIGSSLADKLLEQNNEVICYDNFDNFYPRSIKENNLRRALKNERFHLVEGDIRDKVKLEECFTKHDIDMVIHLAAKAGVRPSILNPEETYDVNISGTLNLLETMRKFKVHRLIFASSSSVYGNNKKVPFSETDNVDFPISPYAASKKACELLCHTYHHLYNFDIFCLRFFTVFGPRQRPDLAICNFTKKIVAGDAIPFFGEGNTKRDYTYIDDIVNGIQASIMKLKGFQIINLGGSRTISLSTMVSTLENYVGKKAVINKLPNQPGDVDNTYADIAKAKEILDYDPNISFDDGIRNFIHWYMTNAKDLL